MGVPADLLGKQVRCPHCKQVVLAPLTVGPATGPVPVPVPVAPPPPPPVPVPVPVPVLVQPPVPVPVPVAPPPPVVPLQPVMIVPPPPVPVPVPVPVPIPVPQPEADLPVFNIPTRKEGADSILSEPDESDDEVFGSHPGGRVRTLSPLDLSPVAHTTPPVEPPVPAPLPATTELPNQTGALVEVSMPVVYVPEPPKPAPVPLQPAPLSVTVPVPAPSAPVPDTGNPFASFDAPATSAPAPTPARDARDEGDADDDRPRKKKKKRDRDDDRDDEPEEQEKPSRIKRAAAAPAGKSNVLLFVVIGWAVIATGLAVYGLFIKSGDSLPKEHPLSTVPDNFGEFPPGTRGKVSQYKFKVDGELPAEQRAALGGKIEVGGLEIEPLDVKRRRLVLVTEYASAPAGELPTPSSALVLRLRIKNVSEQSLFPMDPAFTRKANPGTKDEPITRLVVSKDKVFAGGAINWPYVSIKKRYEQQQKNDFEPLAPGEVREYVVFTDARPDIVRDAQNAKDALQWRVQVRRAPVLFRGKEAPVTAIIGVDFKASEIQ
ncbi:MAG: hypothetical protein FJ304_12895 [Planctomycetes bacterium]|nr:hypothetical protein [Planctomycetota bacterium]